jgi:hypothetical protein
MKAEGHLGRYYLKGRTGDAANALLSAVGHNFRRILAWLRELLGPFLGLLRERSQVLPSSIRLLNGRPVLVLQQEVPLGDGQNRLSVLLALISHSTTST